VLREVVVAGAAWLTVRQAGAPLRRAVRERVLTQVTSNGYVAEAATTVPMTVLTLFCVTVALRPVQALLTSVYVHSRRTTGGPLMYRRPSPPALAVSVALLPARAHAVLPRPGGDLHPVPGGQLALDAAEVGLDGGQSDVQFGRHLFVGAAAGDQSYDVQLTCGERCTSRSTADVGQQLACVRTGGLPVESVTVAAL